MSTDDLERKTSQTGKLRRLKKPGQMQPKPGAQNLVEQVPTWLKRLLAKYGEKEGRLVGLGEGGEAGEVLTPRGGYTGALTNLLEEMAEEGTPEYPPDQLATSVEWGGQDEPETPSFDDFLSGLGSDQTDFQDVSPEVEAPDWITGIVPESTQPESGHDPYALPPEQHFADEAPDWLTEMMGSDASPPPPPPPPPPTSSQVDEAPDWLTEALEAPSPPTPTPPMKTAAPSPAGEAALDIPDWLNAALETPVEPSEPPPQTPSSTPTQADFDAPDWLTETPAEPALPETYTPPAAESSPSPVGEASHTVDVPDWLSDIATPPGSMETDTAESETAHDVPDWLADIAPPAGSIPDLPAWDVSHQITTDMADHAEEDTEKPPPSALETPSWFAQEEGLPSLDWLFEAESDAPITAEPEATTPEYPDWFTDSSAITPDLPIEESTAPETLSSPGGEDVPSWLEDVQFAASVPESETGAIPEWLENIQEETEALEASFDQPPTWLENLQTGSTDVSETDLASDQAPVEWPAEDEAETTAVEAPSLKSLKPLRRLSPQPTSPAEIETSPALPDWAASLVPAETETGQMSPALPDWAADLIPPGAKTAEAAASDLPDWAETLMPSEIEAKTPSTAGEPPEQPASRPLRRLSDVSRPASETPPSLSTETPGSPPALTEPVADEDQASTESPNWLSDLPPAETDELPDWMAETGQAGTESPDWLSNLSAKAGEVPDWTIESSEAFQDVAEASAVMDEELSEETTADEENLLAERLDWFTQSRSEESVPPPTQAAMPPAEQETPDWLTDASPEGAPAGSTPPIVPEVEEEAESLDWLTDLPSPTTDDEPPAPIGEVETSSDLEIPSWLADLSPPSTSSAPVEPPEAEEDVPSWLTEPSDTATVDWPSQTEAEEESEIPSWLTELPDVSAAETTTFAPGERTEAEFETPDWLTDFADASSEAPSEMIELPETAAVETAPAEPTLDVGDEIDEDLESPSWLTDLLDAHDPDTTLSTEPADVNEAEADLESPPWLTDWPEAQTTPTAPAAETESDLEMPSWLAELGEAPEAETTPPPAAEAEEDVEGEAPPWLTLSAPPADEARTAVLAQESENDLEMPSWLAELSEAPTAETDSTGLVEETETEMELETPSWMAGLPETTEATEAPESLVEEVGTETEQDITAWLSEFPEMVETEEVTEESEAEAELEMPAWMSKLPEAAETEAEDELTEVEPAEKEALPAWLRELPEAAATEAKPADAEETTAEAAKLADETEDEEERVIPPWLTGVAVSAAAGAAEMAEIGETAAEVETPSWLADLPEADETEAEAEPDVPSWVSELPEAAEAEPVAEQVEAEPEPDVPAWVSELPEAVDTEAEDRQAEAEAEQELPAWLRELPEAAATEAEPVDAEETTAEAAELADETEDEEELVIPSWLTGVAGGAAAETAETAETSEMAAEVEIPSWLAELPEADETETAPVETLAEIEVEAEPDVPAWVGEFSEIPEIEAGVEEPGAETEPEVADTEALAEAEPEAASWISELSEPSEPETVTGQAEAEAKPDVPAWVSELSEAVETEAEDELAEVEPAAEEELPAWLQELPEAPATEVEPVERDAVSAEAAELADEDDEDLVIPSWLTGVAGGVTATTAGTDETAAEVETPAWLAELSEADEIEGAPVETLEEIEGEAEPEVPSWLSELSKPSETEIVAGQVEAEPEPEVPSGVGELPETAEAVTVTEQATSEAEPPKVDETKSEATEPAEEDEEQSKSAWLAGAAGAAVAATVLANAAEIEAAQEAFTSPDAEAEEVSTSTGPVDDVPTEAELDDDLPPWLADLSTDDLKLPSWLSDAPEFATETAVVPEVSGVETEPDAPAEPVVSPEAGSDEAMVEQAVADDTGETELPSESDWLAGLGAATAAVKAAMPPEELEEEKFLQTEEEPELPAWLTDTPQTAEAAADVPAIDVIPESEELALPDVEPEAPDWLKELSDIEAPLAGEAGAAILQPVGEPKSSPAERMSDWLRSMQPGEEMLTDEDNQVTESTGVLAGLAPLLPAETIAAPTPLLDPQATASTAQADAMLEAARHFHFIATQAPQPAALPEPLTQRDRLVGNVIRGVFYLIFIILTALPLIPGWQKVTDPTTDQKAPWTEPAGELSGILDKQRRELVSAQLGVIDLQQPGSVALVSFDYSTATQGEMQPLAEDIIGRLRGQGMRLIFVSLEPEGAILAQRTLDQNLAERAETYGTEMVNLGYIPGQIAGIRELVTGRKQLSAVADFKEGLTFAAPERAGWSGVNNLGQVDVVITLSDNPVTARWWIEQMAVANPPDNRERFLLAVTSATADPFLRPYLDSHQLDGLISGINGAAAIEAGRRNFGPARQMLDSQGIAHLLIVVLIALGTMFGWMPPMEKKAKAKMEAEVETELQP